MTTDAGRATRPDLVRLGVVGLGAVAQAVHLPLLARLGDRFEIAAVCDLSPSLVHALGDRYGVPPDGRFTDARDLVATSRAEAIVVLSSGAHGPITLAALEAGRPAFVEKPLALTLAETDELAARAGADRVQVGYMKLYDPAVVRAVAAVDAARARGSAVRAVEVTVLHPTAARQLRQARLLPPPDDIPPDVLAPLTAEVERLHEVALGPAARAFGRLYGGILLGSVIHELALIRAFDGDPVAIDAVDVWPEDVFPPSVGIAGRLASGARIDVRWHYLPAYAAYREIVRVVLADRTVELEFPAPYLLHAPTRLAITEPDDEARQDVVVTSPKEAFEEELLAFHALVADGARPRAGIAEARSDVVTCQRVAQRLAEQRGVDIGGEAATHDAGPAQVQPEPVGSAR